MLTRSLIFATVIAGASARSGLRPPRTLQEEEEGQERIDICHRVGAGRFSWLYNRISISTKAVEQHVEQHGDAFPGSPAPGQDGYELDENCEVVDIDECLTEPCSEYATCTNEPGSFSCGCEPGYFGNGILCIDMCDILNGGCDYHNAECTNNLDGTTLCECNDGYHTHDDGETCIPDAAAVPSYGDCPVGLQFTPLAGNGGVPLATVSNCDDCVESLGLPFAFNFLNQYTTSTVWVSSNGQIDITDPGWDSNCCVADAIAPLGYTRPRIAVAQEDLNPGGYGGYGDIYSKTNVDGSVTISYEGVAFYNWPSTTGYVNAQATLYQDGRVFICFGSGGGDSNDQIASGLEDDSSGQHYPNPLSGFDAEGLTPIGQWPVEDCACFFPGA